MLCPKCGQEYEGSECPRCSEPKIVVNENDYLKRKKAFEEKQANNKSAFSGSHNDAADTVDKKVTDSQEVVSNDEEIIKKLREKRKDIFSYAKKGTASKRNNNSDKKNYSKAKGKSSQKQKNSYKRDENESNAEKIFETRKRKSYVKPALILVIALVIVIVSAIGIYNLAIRKNYVMYMSSNGKIYNVSELESSYVCDNSAAVFQKNEKSFYQAKFPEDLNKGNMICSQASNNGKYFAAVMYEEKDIVDGVDKSIYRLYVWNESDCVLVSESRKLKDIKYVTDSGKVIYTDADVVNYEGALGGVELLEYSITTDKLGSITGTLQIIEPELQKFCVYAEKDTIICLNKNNSLYTYDYEKMSGKMGIADDVGYMYAMSENSDNVYTSRASEVNESKNALGVMYTINGRCYYHALNSKSGQEDMQLISNAVSGTEIIYEKGKEYIYIINSSKISYAKIKDDTVGEINLIDYIGDMIDYEYMSNDNEIVYISKDGELSYISKGASKVITDNVLDGSLCRVSNTDKGLVYISSGTRYYIASRSSEAVKLGSTSENVSMEEVILYKNRLYFYNNSDKLLSCTTKGKEVNEIGTVDKFWLGTEIK